MRKFHTFFEDKGATGIGNYKQCSDYDKIGFAIDCDTSTTATIKFQGSFQETAPTFTAVQSSSNQWDYIEVVDVEDGTPIDGDTGVGFTGTDHRMFQMNVDGLTYVNVVISAYTSGAITAKSTLFNFDK